MTRLIDYLAVAADWDDGPDIAREVAKAQAAAVHAEYLPVINAAWASTAEPGHMQELLDALAQLKEAKDATHD